MPSRRSQVRAEGNFEGDFPRLAAASVTPSERRGEGRTLPIRTQQDRSAPATDSFGSKVFYDVAPGKTFGPHSEGGALGTKPFKVLKPGANPPQSFYRDSSHELHQGLNYVKMRDSTESR